MIHSHDCCHERVNFRALEGPFSRLHRFVHVAFWSLSRSLCAAWKPKQTPCRCRCRCSGQMATSRRGRVDSGEEKTEAQHGRRHCRGNPRSRRPARSPSPRLMASICTASGPGPGRILARPLAAMLTVADGRAAVDYDANRQGWDMFGSRELKA